MRLEFFLFCFFYLIFSCFIIQSFVSFLALHPSFILLSIHCFFILSSIIYFPLLLSFHIRVFFLFLFLLAHHMIFYSLPLEINSHLFFIDMLFHTFLFCSSWFLKKSLEDDQKNYQKKWNFFYQEQQKVLQRYLQKEEEYYQKKDFTEQSFCIEKFLKKSFEYDCVETFIKDCICMIEAMNPKKYKKVQFYFQDIVHEKKAKTPYKKKILDSFPEEVKNVFENQKPFVVHNIQKDFRYTRKTDEEYKSVMIFPFLYHQSVFAVVSIYSLSQNMVQPDFLLLFKYLTTFMSRLFIQKKWCVLSKKKNMKTW